MKNLVLKFLLIIICGVSTLYAQLDDLLKKTAIPDILEEKNITTSIDDALPVAFWVNGIDQYFEPVEPENYNAALPPGYYRMTIQSYCLKAGTNAPTKGSGHLIAPLKGKLSDIVENILTRSPEHPEVAQRDIQLLLWAIIAGTKFTDLSADLQMRVRPLLTETEIAELSIGIKDIPLDILPDDLKSIAKFYKELRSKITNPASTYEEIEQMAVISGEPPSQFLKRKVEPGNWAYIGDGFYMRIIPEAYYKSVVELYRPAKINVTRDNLNRIVSMENGGNKIEITFQDEPGSDVMKADDGKFYPIYRFKSIKFTGVNPDEEFIWENTGWMIRGDGKELKNVSEYKNYPQDPTASEYKEEVNKSVTFFKNLSKYKKESAKLKKGSVKDVSDCICGKGFDADRHQTSGILAATNPTNFKGKSNWIRKHISFVTDWWNCSSNSLAENNCDDSDKPKKPNVPKRIGTPGNTAGQRIGTSMRKYGE